MLPLCSQLIESLFKDVELPGFIEALQSPVLGIGKIRAFKIRDSILQTIRQTVKLSQIVLGPIMIGLDSQRLFITTDGLIHFTPVTQGLAQIIPGIGEVWIKPDRFAKGPDRLFMFALVVQGGAEIEMSTRVRVPRLPNASKKPGSISIAFW